MRRLGFSCAALLFCSGLLFGRGLSEPPPFSAGASPAAGRDRSRWSTFSSNAGNRLMHRQTYHVAKQRIIAVNNWPRRSP